MKKRSIVSLLILSVILSMCFFSESDAARKALFVKNISQNLTFKNPYSKEIEIENGVTKEEVEMYNEIMAKLYAGADRGEEEILQEISPAYGMTVDEIRAFLNRVMIPAINVSNPKKNDNAPSNQDLINMARKSVQKITVPKVTLPKSEKHWEIQGTAYKHMLKTTKFKYGEKNHSLILKLQFDTFYENYTIFQIKVDGKNIDLSQ